MITTKEEFLSSYFITETQFDNAEITWEELVEIYNDYIKRCKEIYEPIRNEFMNKYFLNKESKVGLQSYRSRCKNAEHVLEKIIRKKNDNYIKYKKLNKDNYWMFLTDLIGVRGLILYKEDWVRFHEYIIENIQNDVNLYVKDSIKDYIADERIFMAEAPKVHIRSGDYYEIYSGWIPLECILDQKHYRSVHYIVNYKGVYIEIQIRTLFEEGWGEIDHNIIYPYARENKMLLEFSELLNRLSGMGDEMGSYYHRLKNVPECDFASREDYIIKPSGNRMMYAHCNQINESDIITFKDAVIAVINE